MGVSRKCDSYTNIYITASTLARKLVYTYPGVDVEGADVPAIHVVVELHTLLGHAGVSRWHHHRVLVCTLIGRLHVEVVTWKDTTSSKWGFGASEISTGKVSMCLLPDTQNYGMRMRLECRECFPHHRLQRKPLISDPGMHHGTCVTHVPWCMSGSLTRGSGENVPGIPAHAQPAILRILQKAHGEE